jgi:prevent-host-death family protein
MRTVSVSEARAHLNEYVEAAESTHEEIVITRHGRPSVVLLAADDLESLQETIFCLSQQGIRATVAEADADVASGALPRRAGVGSTRVPDLVTHRVLWTAPARRDLARLPPRVADAVRTYVRSGCWWIPAACPGSSAASSPA